MIASHEHGQQQKLIILRNAACTFVKKEKKDMLSCASVYMGAVYVWNQIWNWKEHESSKQNKRMKLKPHARNRQTRGFQSSGRQRTL